MPKKKEGTSRPGPDIHGNFVTAFHDSPSEWISTEKHLASFLWSLLAQAAQVERERGEPPRLFDVKRDGFSRSPPAVESQAPPYGKGISTAERVLGSCVGPSESCSFPGGAAQFGTWACRDGLCYAPSLIRFHPRPVGLARSQTLALGVIVRGVVSRLLTTSVTQSHDLKHVPF